MTTDKIVSDRMTEAISQEPVADDLAPVVKEGVEAAIEDVRALGVSGEELSDEEIIDALQEAVAAELATEGVDQ